MFYGRETMLLLCRCVIIEDLSLMTLRHLTFVFIFKCVISIWDSLGLEGNPRSLSSKASPFFSRHLLLNIYLQGWGIRIRHLYCISHSSLERFRCWIQRVTVVEILADVNESDESAEHLRCISEGYMCGGISFVPCCNCMFCQFERPARRYPANGYSSECAIIIIISVNRVFFYWAIAAMVV